MNVNDMLQLIAMDKPFQTETEAQIAGRNMLRAASELVRLRQLNIISKEAFNLILRILEENPSTQPPKPNDKYYTRKRTGY